MIAWVFLVCVIGSTIWFLCSVGHGERSRSRRTSDDAVSIPDRYATNSVGSAANSAISPWTALDEHQLRRLLDGPSS
jgi:hypothetical protein